VVGRKPRHCGGQKQLPGRKASSLVGLCHERKNILMVPTHAQFRPYSIKDLSSSKLLVPCFPSLAMTSCILRFSLKYPAIEHVRCQEGLRDQDAN